MSLEREHKIMAALPCWTWQGPFPDCGGVGGTGESVDEQEEQADGHCGMRPHKRRNVRMRSSCAGPKQASEFLGESAACCVVAEPSRVDVKKKQQKPPASVPVSVSSAERHEDWCAPAHPSPPSCIRPAPLLRYYHDHGLEPTSWWIRVFQVSSAYIDGYA